MNIKNKTDEPEELPEVSKVDYLEECLFMHSPTYQQHYQESGRVILQEVKLILAILNNDSQVLEPTRQMRMFDEVNLYDIGQRIMSKPGFEQRYHELKQKAGTDVDINLFENALQVMIEYRLIRRDEANVTLLENGIVHATSPWNIRDSYGD
ncbi:MAG: hypothetical protein PHC51_02740 [bacterium]|nr:hypothetical protein [bacterium]